MRDDIVRRVERLALIGIGDHRHCTVVLPAHHAAVEVLARQLAALKIEGVAVAVIGRPTEHRDPPVVPDIAVLHIARDIAEDDVTALARPGRPFRPQRPRPQPIDRTLGAPQRQKGRVDDDDVGVRINRRFVPSPLARRVGNYAGRRADFAGFLGGCWTAVERCCARQTGGTGEELAPRQRVPANSRCGHRSVPPRSTVGGNCEPAHGRWQPDDRRHSSHARTEGRAVDFAMRPVLQPHAKLRASKLERDTANERGE
jgi:hypothetical protein